METAVYIMPSLQLANKARETVRKGIGDRRFGSPLTMKMDGEVIGVIIDFAFH